MSSTLTKKLFKIFKISAITVVSLFVLLFALPYLFPQTVSNKIKQWANGSINGQIAFSSTRLSFFKRFPTLTLTLYDFSLKGSAPFQNDTLLAAKEVSLGINLTTVFKDNISINKIYFTQALINIQADTAGHVNYNVYKSKPQKPVSPADTGSVSLGIDQILIENSRLVYNDRSIPMQITARGFNYTGNGDLSKDVFDLHTHTQIQSIDFSYNHQQYLLSKKVNADLITKINTKSLEFLFQQNNLLINKLPVQFIGRFGFLKNGYDMDLKFSSHESALNDMLTALPAQYLKMLDKVQVGGIGNVSLQVAGKYIAADSTMPNLTMNVQVRNGSIKTPQAPEPIHNLYLNLSTKLPGLDPDSLNVDLDSLYLNIGTDYLSAIAKVKGVKNPDIYTKVDADIDVEKWNKAFDVKPVDLKGKYTLHLLAQGKYSTGVKRNKMHKVDTVITSIPKFSFKSSFSNGYIKYAALPQPITNVSFDLDAGCPDDNYNHAYVDLENLNMNALSNYVKGYLKVSAAPGYPVNAALKANFNLADIKQFYPLDSMTLAGKIIADVQTKGKYIPAKNIFPVTKANINLQNGSVQTKYYPHPIQNIQVSANITNNTNSLKGLKVVIKPVSFTFEDKPFMFKADLKNFNNIQYNIVSKGSIDIGKIYQVFAIKGYNVKGFIQTNLSLKGNQADAMAGNYGKLSNSGTMKVKDISLTSDLFPKPFVISEGNFSFNQDKMQFDAFKGNYGKSVIYLNGSLSNVIDYATRPNAVLKGDLNFGSGSIIADDFMAFADAAPAQTTKAKPATGVILVPKNVNLNLSADVKNLKYNGMNIKNVKGQVIVANGNITLKQTGFNIIDAPVTMDGSYTAISPQKAAFNYHINAKQFDIKKAYNQIKLFHDMASSAAHAEGLISLDYNLSGRLNSNMMPVYPSLKGGGVLSAEKIKMHGFKMLGSVSKSTNHKVDTGDASKVNIETTIANNIITIKQTKMRMAGFRLKFGGQVSFDNQLNLDFRLGLPPLGILGIPMHISGTETKPIIHLGKGKKGDELTGAADSTQAD